MVFKEVLWSTYKEVWWSSDRPGFESRPGASPLRAVWGTPDLWRQNTLVLKTKHIEAKLG